MPTPSRRQLHTPTQPYPHKSRACDLSRRGPVPAELDVPAPKTLLKNSFPPSLTAPITLKEACKSTPGTMTQTEQARHLSESLLRQLAHGREWATPGVQAALQRAVAGLDTGIETASPRLQALLRRLADDLAGGVETLTPRVQAQLKRVGPNAAVQAPARATRPSSKIVWWILGLLALAATGAAVWRSVVSEPEPAPSVSDEETGRTNPTVEADLASGRR